MKSYSRFHIIQWTLLVLAILYVSPQISSAGVGTTLAGASTVNATTTYVVGENNANTAFAGTIADGLPTLRPTADI